jgi:hypothetical protein
VDRATSAKIYLHIPIGFYTLPVPLATILVAAALVVTLSFVLMYVLPPRRSPADPNAGRPLPEAISWMLVAVAWMYLGLIISVALFGRQELAVVNPAAVLFWVLTIPLLPLAHCFIGGIYQVANPFAALARRISPRPLLADAPDVIKRLGYWPAVVFMFLLVIGESVPEIVQKPLVLGLVAIAYTLFQVAMGVLLGEEWYGGGEVFHAITSLASTIAPVALRRDQERRLRLSIGFDPGRFLPEARGRQALITLWLAGVLADGVRATPAWRYTILPATLPSLESMGKFAGVDIGNATEILLEVVITWIAFGAFFWFFVNVAALLSGRHQLGKLAAVVSPSLIPIALAYLFAHNLTQVLVIGPLILSASTTTISQLGALVNTQVQRLSPGPVWWVQAGAIVLGHMIAVTMAHVRLSEWIGGANPKGEREFSPQAYKTDLGWLSAMLIYTATSLWILAQPITASR